MGKRRNYHFLITYYKSNGKFYANALVEWELRGVEPTLELAYYNDAVAKLRGLRDAGGPEALPGLSSNGWQGYITIEQATLKENAKEGSTSVDDYWSDGVPHLLLPG